MRLKTNSFLLPLLIWTVLTTSLVNAQDDQAAADADAADNAEAFAALPFADADYAEDAAPLNVVDGAPVEENKEEECEEAWDYMEFLKNDVKEQIEFVLQDTMFQPQALLEATVADTMAQVLTIRDAVLDRTKAIRTGEGDIVICPEQGIKQQEFLTDLRMDIMTVLLRLIEQDAATPEALQEIGRQLLAIRTTVNGKIGELIMLRESSASGGRDGGGGASGGEGDCDCGVLDEVLQGLDEVINTANKKKKDGDDDAAETEEGQEPVARLTMVLMTVDARIGSLYNEILGQLDEAKRAKAANELRNLKDISKSVNDIVSKLVDEAGNEGKIKRILTRVLVRVRNEVDRLLQDCKRTCTTECEACGAVKIDEALDKLGDYNVSLYSLEEQDAKESIRSDLIQYLTQLNGEMTQLLTTKIESETGTLDQCDRETLEVIGSVKAPLWMLVNITIYSDGSSVNEMLIALNAALLEMRTKYCDADTSIIIVPGGSGGVVVDENQCDLEEVQTAGEWIADIDKNIAENLFKTEDDQEQARVDAMLGFVEMKSSMEERVRQLFQENLVCTEEVDQIKQFYSEKITSCLAEMMNPKYRFEFKTRAQRVQCIKQLRVIMEQRRGDLLLRGVQRRIQERSRVVTFAESDDYPEEGV